MYQIITGTGGIITSISIFYFFVINFSSFQKLVSPLVGAFNFLKQAERTSIAYKIQGNINQFRENINHESHNLIPEAQVEWISEEKEESFYDEYKGKVILRMHPSKDNDINLVKATLLQVSKGVIPLSRMYVEPKMNTSIDLSLVKKILITQQENNAYRYFINEIMSPELVDKEVISYMESIEEIDNKGLFTRLFLRELSDLPVIETLGFTNISGVRNDIYDFFNYSKDIANRKPGELIQLIYEGDYIKTSVIMVAVSYKMETLGKNPYIKRALSYRIKGHEIIFIIAFDHAIEFTKQVINDLENVYGMKLVNNSDNEYVIEGSRYLCATMHTSAKRYIETELKRLKKNEALISLLNESIDETINDGEWVNLAHVGDKIKEKSPDFDINELGFAKLSDLFGVLDIFEVNEEQISKTHTIVYVRKKNNKEFSSHANV